MKQIRKIVVGTDFSEAAESAVDQAVELAALVGATVTLVHAYELPVLSLPDGFLSPPLDLASQIDDAAATLLAASGAQREKHGVRMATVLRIGEPWVELDAVAAQEGADLIVVGTHGRRCLSRVLFGSVAERLLRTASTPVLALPRRSATQVDAALRLASDALLGSH